MALQMVQLVLAVNVCAHLSDVFERLLRGYEAGVVVFEASQLLKDHTQLISIIDYDVLARRG